MAGVKGKRKPTIVKLPMDEVNAAEVETFAQALVDGYTKSEAYLMVHPTSHPTKRSVYELGSRWAARPEVQAKVQEIRESQRKRQEEFRDRLVEMHMKEIEECYRSNRTILPVVDLVKTLTKIMGYEQKTINVDAKVAAMDEGALADKLAFLLGKGK